MDKQGIYSTDPLYHAHPVKNQLCQLGNNQLTILSSLARAF